MQLFPDGVQFLQIVLRKALTALKMFRMIHQLYQRLQNNSSILCAWWHIVDQLILIPRHANPINKDDDLMF